MKMWIIPRLIPGSFHHDAAVLLGKSAKFTAVIVKYRLVLNGGKVGEL
jgi:hypothetical protein